MAATSTAHDDKLNDLRTQWQSKNDQAQALIDAPTCSAAQLKQAKTLFDDRDRIAGDIEARQGEIAEREALKARGAKGADWSNQAARSVPFSASVGGGGAKTYDADAKFQFGGFEDAGHDDLAYNAKRREYEIVNETGAGTFGEKTWHLLNSVEYKRDWAMYLRKGPRHLDVSTKTLVEGVDSQGGVFAPADFISRIVGRLPAPTALRSLVTTLTTSRDSIMMPRKQYSADDKYSTAFRANWTGEIPADGTGAQTLVNDANLLGEVQIPVHTAMLTAPISKNLVEDAGFSVQSWMEGELQQVIDLLYEDMILNGSGIGQPSGILLGAVSANDGTSPQYPEVVLSGSAGALAYDGLINLQMALAPQYENEYTRFVMNKKSTYAALNKMKDSQLRPLFTTGYNDSGLVGRRSRVLLGDDVVLSQFMPNIGAGNFPIIYGDLRGHYLIQRVGFSIQVLDQTRARANQIELVGRVRFGGKTVEPFRLKIQKSNDS